ncbi:acyltransferase [Erwiniaceae bacterium BAC15a-03b]|uniref:Acyltransferase n=1 Tax=Winslowiella arboricola TaxID=2978220 RepID=A0A9J6PT56_9GAMM|nr:acyltransferase [Winslowiella arboricola]MCU5774314.1 acyltransferase [Winslowiella arboricola]MCU5778861.1 acyltransferase [Winslowiella arboricola]
MLKSKNRIGAVEGIRGLACLMVFLSHLSSTFAPSMHTGNPSSAKTSLDLLIHNSPFAFMYSGAAAVGIFFVLSGFILGYALSEKGDVVERASAMFVKRYFRLMPVALFSSVLAYFIFKYISVDASGLGQWAKNYEIKNPSLLDSIYYGSITPFFSGAAPYNWSLWTMKIEMFGSATVCFLTCFLSKTKFKKSIILICMIIPFFMNIKKGDEIYYASFISGLLIYHLDLRLNKHFLTLTFLSGLYLCGFHQTSSYYKWLSTITNIIVDGRVIDNYTLYNNIGGFLVVFSVIKSDMLSKALSTKPLVLLGTLSFSVYAIHQPLMHVFCPSIFNLMMTNEFTYSASSLMASLLTLLITYCLSFFVYIYIDKSSVYLCKLVERRVINSNGAL